MHTIKIKEPRYHDGVVIINLYNVEDGLNLITIQKGAHKGWYVIHSKDILSCPTGHLTSKRGHRIITREVPLSLLEERKVEQ